jgi:serine O-acetyltransferase
MINLAVNNGYYSFGKKKNYPETPVFPRFQADIDSKTKTNEGKKNPEIGKKVLVGAGAVTGLLLTDLFLAKGKILSPLTRGKVSFIKSMSDDIDNFVKNDSYATKGRLEAFLSIPGLHAVWSHRIAHKLHKWKIPVIPRFLSNLSRTVTGIEIHPGANLGKNVFIDQTGAIIGETARVGNNVKLVGRVVLGATGKDNSYLRHPIVEDGATIGMNTTILGRITVGKNSKIGSGAIVTHNVPEETTIIGNPAKIIAIKNEKIEKCLILNKNSIMEVKELIERRKK